MTSSAACSSSGGSSPGSRSASIVLPAPGGPVRNRWCPPAAATSTARRPAACPTTSPRSGAGGAVGQRARAVPGERARGRRRCADQLGQRRRRRSTSMPGRPAPPRRRWPPARRPAGARPAPRRAPRAARRGSARTRPSSPSSPSSTSRSTGRAARRPAAARTAAASARSKPLPCFGIDAGDRPMVIRRCGQRAAGVDHGGPDPVDRLADDGVGQPDQRPPRAARSPCRPRPRPSRPATPTRPTDQVRASGHENAAAQVRHQRAGRPGGTSTPTTSKRSSGACSSCAASQRCASSAQPALLGRRHRLDRVAEAGARAGSSPRRRRARRRRGRRCRARPRGSASCGRAPAGRRRSGRRRRCARRAGRARVVDTDTVRSRRPADRPRSCGQAGQPVDEPFRSAGAGVSGDGASSSH